MVPIKQGIAKIQNGNFNLIHVIELTKYKEITDQIVTTIKEDVGSNHSFYPYLKNEAIQINNLINDLRVIRIKRALNILGSAWKWIAGNPDHDDFEIIGNKMNNMLENNNKQRIINEQFLERINSLTKLTKTISNYITKEEKFNNNLINEIQYKFNTIKEELKNIIYAIHWAKLGIINSLILSKDEVQLAIDTLQKEHLPFINAEEALNFAKIKIATDNSCLLYIISIPITKEEIFEKLLIKPVKRNNEVIQLDYENVIINENKIYSIINNCNSINSISICNEKNILDISNTNCIPKLLKSSQPICNKTNNHHISTIEEISEGLILLNQYNGIISINDETQPLNGTFLIKFHNVTIFAGERKFISKQKSSWQTLPTILQLSPIKDQHHEILSLARMEEIKINNTNHIALLQTEAMIHRSINYGIVGLIVIITISVFIINRKKQKLPIAKNNQPETNVTITLPSPQSTSQETSRSTPELNNDIANRNPTPRKTLFDTIF